MRTHTHTHVRIHIHIHIHILTHTHTQTHTHTHMNISTVAGKTILPHSLRFNKLFWAHMHKDAPGDPLDIRVTPIVGGPVESAKKRKTLLKLQRSVKVAVVVKDDKVDMSFDRWSGMI